MDRYLCCCYVLQSSLRQASMLTRSAYIHSSINRRQPIVKLQVLGENAKNIAWCIAQKNAVQSLVPTCAFWLSAHMVANYMAWSLKISDKLVDAYIHLALNQSARQNSTLQTRKEAVEKMNHPIFLCSSTEMEHPWRAD